MASQVQEKEPQPAYLASPGSILHVDKEFYSAVSAAPRTLKSKVTIPPRCAKAFQVPATHIVRLSTPSGPQVGDLNIWNAHNSQERFWASRTRQLQASHVTTYDRLWSCLPHLRPMVTIIGDSLSDFGVSKWGGRCHDLLGTRCDPYVNKMLTGDDYDFQCHSNLVRSVLPFGLAESDVHDVLNIFQVTGLNSQGKYFMEASPARPGDYIEFFAEQDLLMALSTCPGGDLSRWGWGEGSAGDEGDEKQSMWDCCREIKVEIFEIDKEAKDVLKDWKEPKKPGYKGMHGMKVPGGELTTSIKMWTADNGVEVDQA
ncbi:hypothetical protein TWF569_010151 [Orbilia oligospora]|nr:hypothetical protein TWF706_006487 [Orbilia oligospora]KAF3134575.1 hypothetical protein TWF569_010151 [Orbilia oligospora]KAF3138436.1 hypothetical protein TWF594_007254 [Orbilia oligospora]